MSVMLIVVLIAFIAAIIAAALFFNKISKFIILIALAFSSLFAGALIGVDCYRNIKYSPKEVFVYDKVVVEINSREKVYNYYIDYIYEDECYTTLISGKEFNSIKCNKSVDKFTLTQNEWETSKKRNDNASEKTGTTTEN